MLREDWRAVGFGLDDERETELDGKSGTSKQQKRPSGRLGVNFKRASQPWFEIELGKEQDSKKVLVKQDASHQCLGAVVWDCGILMCKFLETLVHLHGDQWLPKHDVLELGSGTGLAGLCAARLGANSCILTDIPEMTSFLESNVRANNLEASVSVTPYLWGEELREESPLFGRSFSVILCSDVLYDRKLYGDLLQTLDRFASTDTVVVFSLKLRFPEHEVQFFQDLIVNHSFQVLACPTESVEPQLADHALFIAKRLS